MKMVSHKTVPELPVIKVAEGYIAKDVDTSKLEDTPAHLKFSIVKGSDFSGDGYATFTEERPKFSPLTGESLEYV